MAVTFLTDNTPEIRVCCRLSFIEEEISVSLQGPKPLPGHWIWCFCLSLQRVITLYQNSRRIQLVEGAAQVATICFFLLHISRQNRWRSKLAQNPLESLEELGTKFTFHKKHSCSVHVFSMKSFISYLSEVKTHDVSSHLPHLILSLVPSGCLSKAPAWKSFWHMSLQ